MQRPTVPSRYGAGHGFHQFDFLKAIFLPWMTLNFVNQKILNKHLKAVVSGLFDSQLAASK
jgi:hypothetical protein